MRRQASSAVQAARPRQMASTPHQSVFSFTNASLSFAPRGAFAEPPAPEGRAAYPCLPLLPVAPSQSLRRPRVGRLTMPSPPPRGAFAEPPAPEGRAILRPYSMTLLTARLKQQLGTTQECLPDPPPTST